jgi:hypothetical protein
MGMTNNQQSVPANTWTNGIDVGPGVGNIQALTIPMSTLSMKAAASSPTQAAQYSGPLASTSFLGEPFAVWLGLVILLIALKFFSERPKSDLNPAFIRIGGYNFLAVGVTAAVFFALLKVIFNKVPVPGVTQFANAI